MSDFLRPRYESDADYNTNAPSYYDDLARKNELLKKLTIRIWEYDKELAKRFAEWDKNLEELPEDLKRMLQQWMEDGTLDHIINETIFSWKLDTSVFETFKDEITLKESQVNINPLWKGAKGDGVTDDYAIFSEIIKNAPENAVIDLTGKTYLMEETLVLSKPIVFENGKIIGHIEVPAGVSHTEYSNITFEGNDKTGVAVKITYPSTQHRFNNCEFNNYNIGLQTIANMDTQQNLYVHNCHFYGNIIGLSVKDLKRVTITDNKFVANGTGFKSETSDYQGIGMVFAGNYFNANQYGALLEGGIYDTVIANNVFDHNSMDNLYGGGDNNLGYGIKVIVPTGRYARGLKIDNNASRNNGDYSIILIIDGAMSYSTIVGNSAWLDDVNNVMIDYSNGAFSNNVIEANYFEKGLNIIDNGTKIEVDNGVFNAFTGGTIRGKTNFGAGIGFKPQNNFLYTNENGHLQYTNNATLFKGIYANIENQNSTTLKNKLLQTADWCQTADRPTNAPVGYTIFDTTLKKPIWRSLGGAWVDANGTTI